MRLPPFLLGRVESVVPSSGSHREAGHQGRGLVMVVKETEVLATGNKKSEVRIDWKEIETSQGRGDLVCAFRGLRWGAGEVDGTIYDGDGEINYNLTWVLKWSTWEEGHPQSVRGKEMAHLPLTRPEQTQMPSSSSFKSETMPMA